MYVSSEQSAPDELVAMKKHLRSLSLQGDPVLTLLLDNTAAIDQEPLVLLGEIPWAVVVDLWDPLTTESTTRTHNGKSSQSS
jgi:hypothetical protein